MLKEKQQPANGIPHKLAGGIYAASTAVGRGARTPPQVRAATRQRAATRVGGGVPDAPETFCRRPSPGNPPGRACPAPTARRWASPMLSINAHGGVKTPPYGPTRQRVPAPTASSRGYPSTGSHPRRGRHPRRPGSIPSPPIPGTPPGPGMPGPYRAAVGKPHAVRKRPRRGQDPSLRAASSTSVRPPAARRCGNGDKKTEAIPFPGTASVLYISI